MYLGVYADGARKAALARARIRKVGYVFGYSAIWSRAEDQTLRLFWPQVYEIERLLWSRTRGAIKARARNIGLDTNFRCRPWTSAEISRLRRTFPSGTWEEIVATCPGRSKGAIRGAAQRHGIRRQRKPYKPTGHLLIDQIRARCFDLNYRMRDADALARSKRYFYKAGWHSGWINHKAIARAVVQLDGTLIASWQPLFDDQSPLVRGSLGSSVH